MPSPTSFCNFGPKYIEQEIYKLLLLSSESRESIIWRHSICYTLRDLYQYLRKFVWCMTWQNLAIKRYLLRNQVIVIHGQSWYIRNERMHFNAKMKIVWSPGCYFLFNHSNYFMSNVQLLKIYIPYPFWSKHICWRIWMIQKRWFFIVSMKVQFLRTITTTTTIRNNKSRVVGTVLLFVLKPPDNNSFETTNKETSMKSVTNFVDRENLRWHLVI